ncbi:MAG: phytoene desaturase [Gammaproteobacteria bacterium]|nr:phytoene desaturase [Gammaproteobacteria bacterium]
MSLHVAIVGGGLGGLAAACTLASRGFRVQLFEGNAEPGGKAVVLERDGFRFDMGPTIVTMPDVLRRIFADAGRDIDDYLELIRLDPQWRCFFEDGATLDLVEDENAMAAALTDWSGRETAGGYRRFMQIARDLHGISDRYFFWKSVGGIRDTLDLGRTFRASTLKELRALRMGRSVAGTIRREVPDSRVAQMLDHYTQYVGSSPYNSPAVLTGIASMQSAGGVWYPAGGTRAVPAALIRLAGELGVEIHVSSPVRRILHEAGAVTGIELADGARVAADAVVSNMDSVRTHRELIGGRVGERFLGRRAYEPACSGVVLYLGLRQRYEHLLHHNFVFSADPKAEFRAIYEEGRPAPDPTCYLAAPAATEPGVAPEGGEALYVLVHTPYLREGHDWRRMLPEYRARIIDKLKTCGGMPDLEQRIVVESVLTPADIHERYRVLNGAIYGLASHGRFLGAFKPGNRSRDLAGLYLAGGSAHPGPGMPMALMSGWIAADALDEDRKEAADRPIREALA